MPDEMPTQWRDWRKGVGFALDVLGVYLLPLCCLILDYALKWLGTALYPFTLWTFAATGMIAFALSRRATGDRRTTNLAVGALFTTGIGAGIIGLVLLDSVTRGWPVDFTGPAAAVAVLTADRMLERASALLEKARWSSAVAAAGAASSSCRPASRSSLRSAATGAGPRT